MNRLQSYGFAGCVWLSLDLLRTRIFFPSARLVKFPIFVRGRKWIFFGMHFSSGRGLRIEAFGDSGTGHPLIRIGTDVHINDFVHIGAVESVSIGNRVLIASHVFISDHNHGAYGRDGVHSDPRLPPNDRSLSSSPVTIEDDVWLGEFVAVLPGVRIGKGSVVGTMSTVTRSIPPYCLAVGCPAQVIKRFNFETLEWEAV